MKGVVFFLLLLLCAGACVEPFSFESGPLPVVYVIDGELSDRPGPYTVKVFTAGSLDRSQPPLPVRGARVTISDDAGNTDILAETETGIFRTTSIQGVEGRTYVLQVSTVDGSQFISTPQKIIPVGEILNLHAELTPPFTQREDYGFQLYVDAAFTPEQEKHARWKWSMTYQFETIPKFHSILLGHEWVRSPPDCAGMVRGQDGIWRQLMECSCCFCYKTVYNRQNFLSNEDDVIHGQTKNTFLGFQALTNLMISRKMVIIVEQQSLNPDVYAFWQRSKRTQLEGSFLFQTPPPVTRGNVSAVKEGSHAVVGLFAAYGSKSDTLLIQDADIHFYIPGPTSTDSCLDLFEFDNTNVKPSWY